MKKRDEVELRSAIILKSIHSNLNLEFIKHESPDWIDFKNSIGLEVTEMISQDEGFKLYDVSQHLYETKQEVKDNPKIKNGVKKFIDEDKNVYFDEDGKIIGASIFFRNTEDEVI